MKNTFSLMQVLDNLARMPRSGGTVFSGMNPNLGETVAEHSFKVTWLTMMICGRLKKKNNKNFDELELLKVAISHDWQESILLDIPSGSPSYQSYFEGIDLRSVIKKAEEKANETIDEFIRKEIDLKISQIKLNDLESAILKSADIIAMLLEILNWKHHGMRYDWFDYVWANTYKRLEELVRSNLPEIREVLTELTKAYKDGCKPTNPFLTKPEFQNFKK